jgi:hypothetical protein
VEALSLRVNRPDGSLYRAISDCQWILKSYIERDAYVGYDHDAGYGYHSGDVDNENVITRHRLAKVYKAMRLRSSDEVREAMWKTFSDEPIKELERIPPDLDLIDEVNERRVQEAWVALDQLFTRIVKTNGLKEARSSKVLHVLRPSFVAIADSYVQDALGIDVSKSPQARIMDVQRNIRRVGKDNYDILDSLDQYVRNLPDLIPWRYVESKRVPGDAIKVQLTKARILDVLLWYGEASHQWSASPHQ